MTASPEGATIARALARLNQALGALEEKLAQASPKQAQEKIQALDTRWRARHAALENELSLLRQSYETLDGENRKLEKLLQQERAGHASLQATAHAVSESLDRSISHVEQLLAEEKQP